MIRLDLLVKFWPIFALIALVLGGIYGGFFTPTEAGAIGALGALVLILLRRRFTRHADDDPARDRQGLRQHLLPADHRADVQPHADALAACPRR